VLRRFAAHLEKIFGFSDGVGRLRDERVGAQIPTRSVWRSIFWMFVLRLRSFNALEQELRRPSRWDKLLGGRKPSADTIGYTLCRFCVEPLRALVRDHHRIAWRTKAVHGRAGQSLRVVAVDGHELWWSTARCCPKCSFRDITVKKDGQKHVVRQYYHRVVVAQWVGVTPPGILDVEMVNPGEGETVAARRLLDRVLREYPRLVDVITADAIYLEASFLKRVREAGKHFVVVMKQEARELYQDAEQLRAVVEPRILPDGRTTSRLWDLPQLTTFSTLGQPVRVVWAEERTVQTRIVGGHPQEVVEEKTWVWVTDLADHVASARHIQRWGHDRWDLENRGFNELVNLWRMDHCFVHDPTAIEVLLLTLALAFLTTYLFYERNLKPAVRKSLTRLALVRRLAEDILDVALQPSG